MDKYNLKAISIDDYGLYGSLNNFILWGRVLMIVVSMFFLKCLKWYKNGSHGNEMMKFA